jgi:hypothetical protein
VGEKQPGSVSLEKQTFLQKYSGFEFRDLGVKLGKAWGTCTLKEVKTARFKSGLRFSGGLFQRGTYEEE